MGVRWTQSGSLGLWLLCSLSNLTGNIVSAVEISSLKGSLGQSILLCTATDYRNETHSINWIYKTQNQLMAKIQPRENEPGWTITTQDRYKERLSAPDMGCVKIENLTSEDSGLYEAEIMLIKGKIKIQTFNITVSGTVTTESNMKPWSSWVPFDIFIVILLLGIFVGIPVVAVLLYKSI